MRTLLFAPIIAILSSLTTWKVQDLRREAELQRIRESAPPAVVVEPGSEGEADRLRDALEAAQRRIGVLEEKLAEVALDAGTTDGAAAEPGQTGGSAAAKGDPFLDMADAIWRVQLLVMDVCTYAAGSTIDGMGVEDKLRDQLKVVAAHAESLVGQMTEALDSAAATLKAKAPAVYDGARGAAAATEAFVGRQRAKLNAAIQRFLESHPQHKTALLVDYPLSVVGISALVLCFMAKDIWLVVTFTICLSGSFVFFCIYLCCRRRVAAPEDEGAVDKVAPSKAPAAAAAPRAMASSAPAAPAAPAAAGDAVGVAAADTVALGAHAGAAALGGHTGQGAGPRVTAGEGGGRGVGGQGSGDAGEGSGQSGAAGAGRSDFDVRS